MRHRPLLQVRKLFRRGRCPHRPGKIPTVWRRGGYHPPRRIRTSPYGCFRQARFPRPAGQPSQDCPASGSGADAESISCTTRAGCAEPPQESAPRKWGPGLATGALALLGDKPRRSLVLSIAGKNIHPFLNQNEEKQSFPQSSFARFSFLKRSNTSTERHTLFPLPILQNRTKGNEVSHKVLLPTFLSRKVGRLIHWR